MPAVAVEVVAGAAGGAEHRRFGVEAEPVIRVLELWQRQLRQVQLVAWDGIPHGQVATPSRTAGSEKWRRATEEDTAMAEVDGVPAIRWGGAEVGVDVARAEGGLGREEGPVSRVHVEEAQHQGPAMELAKPAAEAAVGVGDDAAPALAD